MLFSAEQTLKYERHSALERARSKARAIYERGDARFIEPVDGQQHRLLSRHLLRFVRKGPLPSSLAPSPANASSSSSVLLFSSVGRMKHAFQVQIMEESPLCTSTSTVWWVFAHTERAVATHRVAEALMRGRGLAMDEWDVFTERLTHRTNNAFARLQYFRMAMRRGVE
jgi:hypothetical protein